MFSSHVVGEGLDVAVLLQLLRSLGHFPAPVGLLGEVYDVHMHGLGEDAELLTDARASASA